MVTFITDQLSAFLAWGVFWTGLSWARTGPTGDAGSVNIPEVNK